MKPALKYSLITFFALLVVGYLVFILCNFSGCSNEKVCKLVEIEMKTSGNQLIGQKDIALILEQNDLNPLGKTIKYISTETIERALLKNAMIKEAECYKTPSGIVHMDIYQRVPKFRIVGNESYYIDDERKWMPSSTNFTAYVPVVSGRVTKTMASGRIFDFITFLEDNPFWNAQIEQIFVRDDLKIELVPRVGESIIILGTLDNYEAKLDKLRKLYKYGFNEIGWNRYKTIDLQYEDQIVCARLGKNKDVVSHTEVEEKRDSVIINKL